MIERNRENGIGAWLFRSDEDDWVFATSYDEAVAHYKEQTGLSDEDIDQDVEIVEIGDLDKATAYDFDVIVGHDEGGHAVYDKKAFRKIIAAYEGTFPAILVTTNL